MRAKPGEAQETLLRFLLTNTDECLIWPHSVNSAGYGQVGGGRSATPISTHVVACEHRNGERPAGMHAAHSCGVRACCNPRHLRWATPAENTAESFVHGTRKRGRYSKPQMDVAS